MYSNSAVNKYLHILHLIGFLQPKRLVVSFCEHGNATLGCMKSRALLNWVRNYQLLKKGSAEFSSLVNHTCELFSNYEYLQLKP